MRLIVCMLFHEVTTHGLRQEKGLNAKEEEKEGDGEGTLPQFDMAHGTLETVA